MTAFLVALALGVGVTEPTAKAGTPGVDLSGEDRLLKDAQAAFERRELVTASRKLKRAIDAPEFARLSSAQRHEFLALAGAVATEKKDWPAAHSFFVRASDLPESTPQDWSGRANAAFHRGYRDDHLPSLTWIARFAPALLDGVPDRQIFWALVNAPNEKQEAAQLRLLDALFDAGWTMRDGSQPSSLWRDLAWMHKRFEPERAEIVAARISDPYVLASMRVDQQFAGLVARNPAQYDVNKAVELQLDRSRKAMASRPRSLACVIRHVAALIAATKYQEAFEVAGTAIAGAAEFGDARYDDVVDMLPWLYDNRSKAARALGRWEDAATELEKARQLPELGRPNVSQSINLGALYSALDRPQDAFRAISGVQPGQLSAFGRMQFEFVRYEAAVELGDQVTSSGAMTWMRDHEKDSPRTLQDALLSANEMDEATRVFVGRLARWRNRTSALLEIQKFAPIPMTPRMQAERERLAEFLARADVARRVKVVGSIESFNLPNYALISW